MMREWILKRARDARDVCRGGAVRKGPADFEIRIDAFFEASKELKDHALPVHDGAIGLLRFEERRFEDFLRTAKNGIRARRPREEFAGRPLETAALRDGRQQRVAKLLFSERLIEDPF